MTEASPRSGQTTFEEWLNSTPSAALESGRTPFASPAGPTTARSGPARAPASRSRAPAAAPASPTPVTSGPSGSDSSPPVDLLSSLESRLRARLASSGSTLFDLTWKVRVTPAGHSISALRAQARRTSASASTSSPWPTPAARDWRDGRASSETMERNSRPLNETAVMLAPWPTPVVNDAEGSAYTYSKGNHDTPHLKLLGVARLAAGYPTPRASDGRRAGRDVATTVAGPSLPTVAGWATPCAQEPNGTAEQSLERKRRARANGKEIGFSVTNLTFQAQMVPGPTSSGSPAPMEKRAQLNAEFVRWLMGLPSAWGLMAPWKASRGQGRSRATATRSSRRSPPSSSPP